MDSFKSIIQRLKLNLSNELPGASAQARMAPTLRSDLHLHANPDSTTRQSAVLIPVFAYEGLASTLLIRRTTYNGVHSGQISFPGGKQEEHDTDLIQTALREAQEEVGIDPTLVKVVGTLTPLYIPVSNMMVLPVVGVMPSIKKLHLNLQEVEYTITARLSLFKNPDNFSVKTICINKQPISAPFYTIGKEEVWGATAMIISELTELY
ncbi:MAG: NUDIX hydrolase [Bacteroidales bacterium]